MSPLPPLPPLPPLLPCGSLTLSLVCALVDLVVFPFFFLFYDVRFTERNLKRISLEMTQPPKVLPLQWPPLWNLRFLLPRLRSVSRRLRIRKSPWPVPRGLDFLLELTPRSRQGLPLPALPPPPPPPPLLLLPRLQSRCDSYPFFLFLFGERIFERMLNAFLCFPHFERRPRSSSRRGERGSVSFPRRPRRLRSTRRYLPVDPPLAQIPGAQPLFWATNQ